MNRQKNLRKKPGPRQGQRLLSHRAAMTSDLPTSPYAHAHAELLCSPDL